MLQLINGCKCSDPAISPADYKKTGVGVNKDWFVQYRFYDPLHADKYPKGYLVIVKGGINKYKTVAMRRQAADFVLQEVKNMLLHDGYNPITKTNMVPVMSKADIDEYTPLMDALKYVAGRLKVAKSTAADLRSMFNVLEPAAAIAGIKHTSVGTITRRHVKMLLEATGSNEHRYNKYRSYLMILFKELVELDILDVNPVREISKKTAVKKLRDVVSIEDRQRIYMYLIEHKPDFFRFIDIFFHSGARVNELLLLQKKHVDIKRQVFMVTVNKGRSKREVLKPIKNVVLHHWTALMRMALNDNDYIFSVGLEPGKTAIRREQITRRWHVHVKEPLGITADFYSLKHANIDETAALLDINAAAQMASHTNTGITLKHYAIGEQQRSLNKLIALDNTFIPKKEQ